MKINSDFPSKRDLLDRKYFAVQIAQNLIKSFDNGFESIVFGLNGKWGSGKSTLLGFIEDEIKKEYQSLKNENYIIFKFNPWMFSGQNELQNHFLSQLGAELGDTEANLKDKLTKLKNILNKATWLKYFSSSIGEGLKDFKNVLEELTQDAPINNFEKGN